MDRSAGRENVQGARTVIMTKWDEMYEWKMEKSVVWYTKALNHRKITLQHGLDCLQDHVIKQCYFGIIYIRYSYFIAFTLYFQLSFYMLYLNISKL